MLSKTPFTHLISNWLLLAAVVYLVINLMYIGSCTYGMPFGLPRSCALPYYLVNIAEIVPIISRSKENLIAFDLFERAQIVQTAYTFSLATGILFAISMVFGSYIVHARRTRDMSDLVRACFAELKRYSRGLANNERNYSCGITLYFGVSVFLLYDCLYGFLSPPLNNIFSNMVLSRDFDIFRLCFEIFILLVIIQIPILGKIRNSILKER